MTRAEIFLWQEIRKKQISGFGFKRQYSIGGFIVDFYCPKVKLAIEVDGKYHEYNKEYDKAREEFIKRFGIIFLRFKNEEVINNWDIVNLKIEKRLIELSAPAVETGELPPPAGEGV